ncbi:MAG: Crp/Fnr family transcriptional regulator [Deltaproteobacteria bacterium]|nr:Crp/Fnr family transcriptional regulator [Deltaproteobacteria bacterium]
MQTIPTIISESLLFNGLGETHLKSIFSIASERTVTRGELIFSEGDPGNGFYIIIEGRVKVFKLSMEGKEQILHIFDPGEPIGEVPVFSGDLFPASASAVEKSSLLFFPRKGMIKLINTDPDLALNMLAVMAKRLRRFTVQIENLALKEVPARLAGYFLLLAQEQESQKQIGLKISKGQLAAFLGTTPETISRMLKKMSDQDLIVVDGARISLTDYNGLEELAASGRI